jgi:hypothetical protein
MYRQERQSGPSEHGRVCDTNVGETGDADDLRVAARIRLDRPVGQRLGIQYRTLRNWHVKRGRFRPGARRSRPRVKCGVEDPHRTPVDVRILAAPAQGQRLVTMVVTGSPNRRSALCGKSARSQRETGRGSAATMISSNR